MEVTNRAVSSRQVVQRVGHGKFTGRGDCALIQGCGHGDDLADRSGFKCILDGGNRLRCGTVGRGGIGISQGEDSSGLHVGDDDGTPVGVVCFHARIEGFLDTMLKVGAKCCAHRSA